MSKTKIWRIRKRIQRMVLIDGSSRCGECGSTKNLHRHHEDGNIEHNDRSNIVIICSRCHIKAHLAMNTWSHGLEYDASVAAD